MAKLRKMFRNGEKGFTLIELLVVIAILGAIAAVVVLNVGQFMGRGCTEAAATELHNIQTAVIAQAVSDNNTLPTSPCNHGSCSSLSGVLIGTPHGDYSWDTNGKVTQNAYSPCVSGP
jgi:type IV pilus assembly protein PilA